MFQQTDYIVIGSVGFAQVGDDDYTEKNKVEQKAILEFLNERFPMPAEFNGVAGLSNKRFSHEFGAYHEMCVIYYPHIVSKWEDEEDEKYDMFWDWVNNMEALDLEEHLMDQIKEEYYKTNRLTLVKGQNDENRLYQNYN